VTAYGTIAGSRTLDPAVDIVLHEFVHDKLYGAVEIKFEAGRVVLIRKTESIKPVDRINRNEDDEQR